MSCLLNLFDNFRLRVRTEIGGDPHHHITFSFFLSLTDVDSFLPNNPFFQQPLQCINFVGHPVQLGDPSLAWALDPIQLLRLDLQLKRLD